jgi:hypothetical protein
MIIRAVSQFLTSRNRNSSPYKNIETVPVYAGKLYVSAVDTQLSQFLTSAFDGD